MATPKTWTATDLKMGAMRLELIGADLALKQGYSFKDEEGTVIDALPKQVISYLIPFASLPAEMQTALAQINNYMYALALQEEGMTD